MKRLNFFPHYKAVLENKSKTTTFRLPDREKDFEEGEKVLLTVGWHESQGFEKVHPAIIERVYEKKVSELEPNDFEGESRDCLTRDAVPLVLSAIYRRVVGPEDIIRIIKFKHASAERSKAARA